MYIDNIESFIEAGQQLFINSPGQVQFLLPFFVSFPTLTSHEQNPTHPAWCLLASNVWPFFCFIVWGILHSRSGAPCPGAIPRCAR